MKILVVTQYFYPENFRINDVCKELVKKGHDVTVLTGLPNYPEGKIHDKYHFFKNRNEIYEGVKIKRVSILGRGNNSITLLLNYFSFMFNGKIKSLFLEKDFDVVYVYQLSPITSVTPGITYAKKNKVPLIINCLDLWPESIKIMNIKESSFIYKFVLSLSKYIYNKGTSIIVPSRGFKEYLNGVCLVRGNEIIYLPNHAENEYLTYEDKISENEKIHLLFAGNIGKAQYLDGIVEAVSLLNKNLLEKVIIDIVGNGSYLEELQKIINAKNLSNVFIFHGRKELNELREYYEKAHAYLLTLNPDSEVSKTVPAKLQSYMAAGKPILGCINGSAADLIDEANCGLNVRNGDVKEFSKNIEKFILNIEDYIILGHNGRKYFKENFTLEIHTNKLIKILEGGIKNV